MKIKDVVTLKEVANDLKDGKSFMVLEIKPGLLLLFTRLHFTVFFLCKNIQYRHYQQADDTK
jgi:hypothetical protein